MKAARTRTLDQYKGLDSELEAGRKVNVVRWMGFNPPNLHCF